MSPEKSDAVYIISLQNRLQEKAVGKTREWWEAYMKRVIPFRGVKMPVIRTLLHQWVIAEGIGQAYSLSQQKELALALISEPLAEDKLAGILYLQEILLPAGAIDWRVDLPRFAELFEAGWISDWNICDWFCVKVLGPLIQQAGGACAAAVAAWSRADNLWQARASVVAFVTVADNSDYYLLIEETCQLLIRRPERFAKTSVGWLLRDVSRHDRQFASSFLEDNLAHFSLESLKNATKHFASTEQASYKQRLKSLKA